MLPLSGIFASSLALSLAYIGELVDDELKVAAFGMAQGVGACGCEVQRLAIAC